MKKRSLAAGLTAATMLALTPAMAATSDSALVKGGALNLRETASLSAKVLGQYPTGTLVEVLEAGSDWHKVQVEGKVGYMMSKFLNTAEGETLAKVKTNTGAGLNMREAPSPTGKLITSVKNGETVQVMQKGKTWSRVLVNGQEGYMATQYLSFGASTPSTPSTPSGQTAVVHNPKATQVLNLRKEASLQAKVLDYYYNGTKVTILKDQGTWVKVQVEDGKVGYMMRKYLSFTSNEGTMQPFTAKTINVNGGSYVNFRKGASLSAGVIARVPVGQSVTVLEHGTDWCKVMVGTDVGYVSTWFLAW